MVSRKKQHKNAHHARCRQTSGRIGSVADGSRGCPGVCMNGAVSIFSRARFSACLVKGDRSEPPTDIDDRRQAWSPDGVRRNSRRAGVEDLLNTTSGLRQSDTRDTPDTPYLSCCLPRNAFVSRMISSDLSSKAKCPASRIWTSA